MQRGVSACVHETGNMRTPADFVMFTCLVDRDCVTAVGAQLTAQLPRLICIQCNQGSTVLEVHGSF